MEIKSIKAQFPLWNRLREILRTFGVAAFLLFYALSSAETSSADTRLVKANNPVKIYAPSFADKMRSREALKNCMTLLQGATDSLDYVKNQFSNSDVEIFLNDQIVELIQAGNFQIAAWQLRKLKLFLQAETLEVYINQTLENGKILPNSLKEIRRGSTLVYSLKFENGMRAVFKPDPALWPYRQNQANANPSAEVAAYRLSRLLQLSLVPQTVIREIGGIAGSLQVFVDLAESPYRLEYGAYNFSEQILSLFDYLINNTDRGGGGNSLRVTGFTVAWDHGLAFQAFGRHINVPNPQPRLPKDHRRLDDPGSVHFYQQLLKFATPLALKETLTGLVSQEVLNEVIERRDTFIREYESRI